MKLNAFTDVELLQALFCSMCGVMLWQPSKQDPVRNVAIIHSSRMSQPAYCTVHRKHDGIFICCLTLFVIATFSVNMFDYLLAFNQQWSIE